MSVKANKTLIGGFVVGAVALAVVAILVFGGGRLFKDHLEFVTYFEGSVKGLGVGSKVQMKGVTVGQVKELQLLFNPEYLTFINRVLIEVDPGSIASYYDAHEQQTEEFEEDEEQVIDMLITRGLRAKLAPESIVTGKLLVSFDFYPKTPARLRNIEKKYIEIPTLQTDFEKIAKTLGELPLEYMVYKYKEALEGINNLVNSPELKQAVQALKQTLQNTAKLTEKIDNQAGPILDDFGNLVRNVDAHVGPMADSITDTARDAQKLLRNIDREVAGVLDSAEAALDKATETLEAYEDFAEEDSQFRHSVNDTLKEIEMAARSIRQLADYLEKHPESLLRGKSAPGGR